MGLVCSMSDMAVVRQLQTVLCGKKIYPDPSVICYLMAASLFSAS